MHELKPCPFCGSSDIRTSDRSFAYWIACNVCDANFHEFSIEEFDADNNSLNFLRLINKWNSRV